jgi:hypothetical protein
MDQVTMEIIEPYERQCNDVVVNIMKTTVDAGVPSKTESLFLRLRNASSMPNDEIKRIAMSKIEEHLVKMPEDA